jgi:MFS family permease
VPLGVALVALSSGTLATSLAAIVGDLAKADQKGLTIGGLATAGDIGSAAGPLVAFALVAFLDLRWIYLLSALALASAMLVTVGKGRPTRSTV